MRKVFVVGIDAASWNLIDPWIKDGQLPTFKKLTEEGVSGSLESCLPFVTSPAWKCFSTGKNPGKLGVFYWFNFDREKKQIVLCSSRSFQSEELWDYLGRHGFRCGVINVPLTYPPKKVNGFMISGIHAFDWSNYTYPERLKEKLREQFNYKISPTHHYTETEEIMKELKEIFHTRFKVATELFKSESPDFLILTIFAIDGAQHYHWDSHKNLEREGNILLELWKTIDRELGTFLRTIESLESEFTLFVISDHGAHKIKARLNANMWLLEKNYLHLKEELFKNAISMGKLGLSRERITILFKKYGRFIRRFLNPQDIVMKGFGQQFLDDEGEIGITALLDKIDWDKTKAVMIGEGLLYITGVKPDTEEYSNLRDRLVEELESIREPLTGERVLSAPKRETVYKGKYVHKAPDLTLVPREGFVITDYISRKGNIWVRSSKKFSSWHTRQGLFIAYGHDIRKSFRINEATIYDVMPTILNIFEVPSPPDIDGKILKDIFKE